ncbi:aspartate/tyrosine/aromatic aminotransferase [Jejubacter calystegiae]|uniref:Aminotransferase n=1 Tax=Jejubacter calystegiae TaxID=2579935 RepID=A0A4P8YRI2_9ENTR|nr:amino acid aminotransferase [Jejubacter calystegiae]QCT21352.1 aspartate/tyrosine/aromatic aminotransferase [Jejubacter calystegiae]
MFSSIGPSRPDPIMSLMEQYLADDCPHKVNLGIGLYYDGEGTLPLLNSVHEAQQRLMTQERPHSYPPIEGQAQFREAVQRLIFGHSAQQTALTTLQTLGGSGALRLGAELLRQLGVCRIHLPDPTWPNHLAIFSVAGLTPESYPWYDNANGELLIDALLDRLATLPEGSVVLLHPACHNPTGMDPSPDQWRSILDTVERRRLLPFFDAAYQGFGAGIEQDIAPVRQALERGLPFLLSHSLSKNMALYGQRVGSLSLHCPDVAAINVLGTLKGLVRSSYSCPPTFGSDIAATVLNDAALHQCWRDETEAMRLRILAMRQRLATELNANGAGLDIGRITRQRGMFSYTGLSEQQVDTLRQDFSIYLVNPGRICVPGLTERNVDYVAASIASVTR